ncbi:MAG: sterol desaturase family protein [Alphaproteobacteria bacterium]
MPDFPDILMYAAPFFVLFVAIEWFFVRRKVLSGRYEIKDAWASMGMGVGNLISDLTMGFISFAFLMLVWQFRFFDWGYGIWAVLAALVAQDFVYYWKHRAAHRVRWFWSAHVVHHSSEHYNLTTALRQPWNNHITGHVMLSTPLVLIGIHPLLLAFVSALNLLYQFWIHTEAINKMPRWFEYIFNTPSHHRAHHATNPRYLDSNFAGIFITWDRMFGSFVPEQEGEPITYGIVKPVGTFNPVKIAFVEMVNIFKDMGGRGLTLTQRLGYMFAPPGYSHDGSRQGSHAIKQDYVKTHPEQAGTPGLPPA